MFTMFTSGPFTNNVPDVVIQNPFTAPCQHEVNTGVSNNRCITITTVYIYINVCVDVVVI